MVQRGCPYRRTRRTGRDPTATAHLSLTPATTQVNTTLVLHGVMTQGTVAAHLSLTSATTQVNTTPVLHDVTTLTRDLTATAHLSLH